MKPKGAPSLQEWLFRITGRCTVIFKVGHNNFFFLVGDCIEDEGFTLPLNVAIPHYSRLHAATPLSVFLEWNLKFQCPQVFENLRDLQCWDVTVQEASTAILLLAVTLCLCASSIGWLRRFSGLILTRDMALKMDDHWWACQHERFFFL